MSKNVTEMSRDELNSLMGAIQQQLAALDVAQQLDRDESAEAIAASVATLSALIGPDKPTSPGLNSLTEIQKYSDAEIAANVALAFRRVFAGMELLARTTRDLARVVD